MKVIAGIWFELLVSEADIAPCLEQAGEPMPAFEDGLLECTYAYWWRPLPRHARRFSGRYINNESNCSCMLVNFSSDYHAIMQNMLS